MFIFPPFLFHPILQLGTWITSMNGAGLTTMKLLASKVTAQLCVVHSGAEAEVGAVEEEEEEEVLAVRVRPYHVCGHASLYSVFLMLQIKLSGN